MLPIKIPTKNKEENIEALANNIIQIKKQDPSSDTSAQEAEIDRLVYSLYGLTEEETAIVEGFLRLNGNK